MNRWYVYHAGTGTLIDASECALVRLSDDEADKVSDGATIPDDIIGHTLTVGVAF